MIVSTSGDSDQHGPSLFRGFQGKFFSKNAR